MLIERYPGQCTECRTEFNSYAPAVRWGAPEPVVARKGSEESDNKKEVAKTQKRGECIVS